MIFSFISALQDIYIGRKISHKAYVLIPRCQPRVLQRNNTFNRTELHTKYCKKTGTTVRKMSLPDSATVTCNLFKGKKDRFGGIIVDSEVESSDDNFSTKLLKSLEHWSEQNVRAVWFRVALQHAEWVPVLAKNGFMFHHAEPMSVSMVKWLPITEICNIPQYAHTMIGVGAVVVNKDQELLVVRERFHTVPHWKLPGGYLEPGEDIPDAAIREVLEETNVQTEFRYLICFRHTHGANFACSDIYFIVCLTPISESITKCDREIADCRWMKISDYLTDPGVIETNRFFLRKYLEYEKSGSIVGCVKNIHPLLKKPQCLYSIDNMKDASKI
ncbi:uncharacterized protein LOC126236444 isoform X2 [Schistocerca nitens]|uniref:uncharacterized protein LOC126236444 isoform X2 n=1 Tax=Schistocerca nitens TaxID=7011 RepID=UPI0021184512|nr:uncharacterized protein LOC126236444 isoform X2 [Schistocerca nitens]